MCVTNLSSKQEFDIVVLGGGSGGYATALRASQLNLSVVLIEEDKLGGTCLHRGCIPTKALLHSAEVADTVAESAKFGVLASLQSIDIEAVNAYKEAVITKNFKGLQGLLKSRSVTVVQGTGKVISENTVAVDGIDYVGKNLVLATGSYSRSLPSLEITGRVITSDQALELNYIPKSAIILGGGVIGVEFASVWKSFGVDVTIIEGSSHLVPNEDVAISKSLERAFRNRGIKYSLGTFFSHVSQNNNGVNVTLKNDKSFTADILLVAVGRGPRTENMGFAQIGINMDRGYVLTNERLQTNLKNVYAAGDIVPGLQLAHRGFAHGTFIAEEIAGLNPTPLDEMGIPKVTYCEPEIASVGLTETEAKQKFGEDLVQCSEYNLAGNGKSSILHTAGFVKLVRQKNGPVVGIHMIGSRMGEQIGEAQLIVNWEAYPEEVAQLFHAHPTQNEALGEAHMALAGKPLHAHS